MPTLDTYRKQAKQLIRWHRDRDHSVGGQVRLLARYRHLTDIEALALAMPLALAQEIVAAAAGFAGWPDLKRSVAADAVAPAASAAPVLSAAVPILFVRDVAASATFYERELGFAVDFLHGKPPFYGAVSRDAAVLHLRFVHEPSFAALAAQEQSLILATIEVTDVKALFEEIAARGVDLPQRLVRHPWGASTSHVRDPDGNVVSFVQYRSTRGGAGG